MKEHFVKQSYRNRCTILGANGPLHLITPIEHGRKEHQPMDAVRIAYHQDWQREQWQSLSSAYRSSPYFEYFEPELQEIWHVQHELLVQRNLALLEHCLELIGRKPHHNQTTEYIPLPNDEDLRYLIHPKRPWSTATNYPKYPQVFEDRHPFIPDLSILDLLFNLGPRAAEYLHALPLQLT